MRTRHTILLLLLIGTVTESGAQYYETGQDPASLKWREIETEHFRFIFPDAWSGEAALTAFSFERSYSRIAGIYGERPARRLPVILHPYSTRSNGYVAWAPRRVELYPYAGQNSIPMSQVDQLALHELVHVSQMMALGEGMAKPLRYLLGEQFEGALSIFTPFWFLEGDAVVYETTLSSSGRGRQPAFSQELRALSVDRELYSYDKMVNGSYRDYTPDHYRFGYQMAAYGRAQYGDDLFSRALEMSARRPWVLNPFNRAFRKEAGITKRRLYDSTFTGLALQWQSYDAELEKSDFDLLADPGSREYISYHSPVWTGGDTIIAVRRGLSEPPSFVMITGRGERERRIHSPGYMWPYHISYGGGLVAWAEERPDPRWENRNWSVIRTLNINTGVSRTITLRSRLFAPAVNPDGTLIVASENSPENLNSLVILNGRSGAEIRKVEMPGNLLPIYPAWSPRGDQIVFITLSDLGEGVMEYNYLSGGFRELISPQYHDLQSVAYRGDTILFVSSESGIDNVWALPPGEAPVMITSSRFGVSDISLMGDRLLLTDYTAGGNRVVAFGAETKYDNGGTFRHDLVERISKQQKPDFSGFEQFSDGLVSEPYRKWKHLLGVHSWMPFYTDINTLSFDNTVISPGLTLMSQNHLSTLIASAGYEYSNGEHLLHNTLTWKGWYPVAELDLTYGGDPVIYRDDDGLYSPSAVERGFRLSGSIYLPLTFNTGNFNQTLYTSARLSYRNDYIYEESTSLFDYGQFLLTPRLYFSTLRRMAYRDIYPKWGAVVDISSTFSPSDREIYGPINSFRSSFYLPGIVRNHGVRLNYQSDRQDFARLLHFNRATYPRGYNHIISGKLVSMSADYKAPLAYPDLAIGGVAYLKRIRCGLFLDYAFGESNYYFAEQRLVDEREFFMSAGGELVADFNLFRMPFDFTGGLQAAWLPYEGKPWIGAIFNIDIFGFAIGREKEFRLY